MIISYSETLSWDSCPRQYYYQVIRKMLPNDLPAALSVGIKGHGLLQAFYQGLQSGLSKAGAKEMVTKKANTMVATEGFSLDAGELLKAWSLVEKFISETEFNHEVALVENRFLFPLNKFTDNPLLQDVQIGFTPDVVFKRKGDFYTVEDSKFVGRAWPQKKLNRFPQAKLYGIFLKKMGYNVTQSSVRFFNTQTNEISVFKDHMTVEEPAILIRDFIATVKEIVDYKRYGPLDIDDPEAMAKTRRTMNYSACQYCWFEQPCTMEAQGKSAESVFRYLYKENDYDYSA